MKISKEIMDMLNYAPCGMGLFYPDVFNPFYFNDAFFQMIGYSREECDNFDTKMENVLMYPEDRKELMKCVHQIMKNDPAFCNKFRLICKNGDILWIKFCTSMIQMEGREFFIGSLSDITEEVENTLSMKMVSEDMKSSVSIYEVKEDQVECVFTNSYFFTLLGSTEEQFQQNQKEILSLCISKEDRDRIHAAAQKSFHTKEIQSFVHRLYRQDGQQIWVNRRILMKPGRRRGTNLYISVVNDISDLKEQEIRAEQASREKDDVLNSLPVGIGIFEIIDGITYQRYMNDWFYHLVEDDRESRNERHKGNFLQVIYPDDKSNVMEAIEKVKSGQDYVVTTCRAITGTGGTQWIRMIASVVERKDKYIRVYCSYTV